MGILSSLLGTETAVKETSKTVNNIFDTVARGIDAAIYTPEEKAVMFKDVFKLRLETLKVIQANFTPGDALTRRVLAFIIAGFYFGGGLISWGLGSWGVTAYSGNLLYKLITTNPPSYVTQVLVVYFGYYGIKQGVAKWKG